MEAETLNVPSTIQLVCDNATVGLYNAAAGLQTNGNLLISPLSIVYASLLLYLGARGDTKSNLDTALNFQQYFGGDSANITSAFADALSSMKIAAIVDKKSHAKTAIATGPGVDASFQLALANGIFVEESYKLDQDYLSNAMRYLKASITPEKFIKNSEAARDEINNWVDARTGGKIKDLVPSGAVDQQTKAVLVNAVYFKSRWQTVFPPSSTKKGDFSLLSGKKSSVDFMNIIRSFNYADNGDLDFQYLEVPYTGYEASMLVFLPRKVDGLRELEKALTPEVLRDMASQADDSQPIDVSLPKFKTGSSLDLVKLLQKIGVNDVFTQDADLSGMAPSGDVQVSSAFHKTFIDVNEKGTEAAAASAMVVQTRSGILHMRPLMPPIVFKADHPFLYAIRHNPTKLIVFIGRVETL